MSKVIEMSQQYHQRKNKEHHSRATLKQFQREYFLQFDEQLDNKFYPPFWLENEQIAGIVFDSLLFNNNKQYELWSFTIMPNHVHALLSLLENSLPLYAILQKHKRYSAWQSNKVLGRTGHFWQQESCDHLVRKTSEFHELLNYIVENPVKAGLIKNSEDWKWTYLNPKLALNNQNITHCF